MGHSKLNCKRFLSKASRCVQSSDGSHIIPGKLSATMCLAGCSNAPSLFKHIGGVIFFGAKKQMGRIYARRVVASVEDKESVWNRSDMKCPRSTMGQHQTCPKPCGRISMPEMCLGSRPLPAWSKVRHMLRNGAVLVDFIPKAFREVFRKSLRGEVGGSNFDLHQSAWLIVCRALSCFSNVRAISFVA